jgi:hypothetical protein
VIGSYYPEDSYEFVEETDQYDALELLSNSEYDASTSDDLLLQRYVLALFDIYTEGNMYMKDKATCEWSGVTCHSGGVNDGSIKELNCTYSTVKTEPVICNMRSLLTAVLFSKQCLTATLKEAFLRKLDF